MTLVIKLLSFLDYEKENYPYVVNVCNVCETFMKKFSFSQRLSHDEIVLFVVSLLAPFLPLLRPDPRYQFAHLLRAVSST